MPIVKQWDGWFGTIKWRVQVKYSGRTAYFTIALPESAHDHFGKELRAKTQREVERDFELKHEQFKGLSCEKRKVILLELVGNNNSWNRGVKLVLRCGVFEKRIWPEVKGTPNIVYEELESSIPKSAYFVEKMWKADVKRITELEWTENLEGQIAGLVKAVELLRDRLQKICATPNSLITALNGNKLLVGDIVKVETESHS